uniref:vimentin-like n=1 Tax=Myxine glutinosa TaxID=7769 RepID=UPI003590156B
MEIPTFSVNTSYEVDVSVAEVVNADFRMRSNEKVEMQDLNDRFATYIDKVHILEQKNRRLRLEQTEGEAPSSVYEEKIRELTRNVEELRTQKCHDEVQRDNLNEQIKEQQHKLQKEANLREEAERNLQQVKKNLQDSHKNVDNAKLVQIGLEQKIETQQQEINFIKLLYEKELRYLKMQQFPVEVDMLPPNLTGSLRDIHAEYESIATKKLTYAEVCYNFMVLYYDSASPSVTNTSGEFEFLTFLLMLQLTIISTTKSSQRLQTLARTCLCGVYWLLCLCGLLIT